jgi:hypothetical protein
VTGADERMEVGYYDMYLVNERDEILDHEIRVR